MRVPLVLHPDGAAPAVRSIEVVVARDDDGVRLDYLLIGDMDALALPLELPSTAVGDPIWQHSCFEAFFRTPALLPSAGYTEYNFATWRGWAAYGFSGYRELAAHITGIDPQVQVRRSGADAFHLTALVENDVSEPLGLGLSAVIEDRSGAKSYWALAHPPGKPDFHHPDCFALTLPAPGSA